MKYRTFKKLIIAGALVSGAGLWFFGSKHCGEEPAEPRSDNVIEPRAVTPAQEGTQEGTQEGAEGTAPVTASKDDTFREMDRKILWRIAQEMTTEKIKDVFKDASYKVNIYRDAAQTKVNRAKVDLDRDDKWDEKWTFSGEDVKRKVAPKDDEDYTLEYRLRHGAWVQKKE